MVFVKGNKAAVGNKGGGRKSAYQEEVDAKMLYKMFFGLLKERTVKGRIKSGNYSLKDKFVEQAYKGNERILSEIFKKLFPEKYEHDFKKPVNITVTRVSRGSSTEGTESVPESDDSLAHKDTEGLDQERL